MKPSHHRQTRFSHQLFTGAICLCLRIRIGQPWCAHMYGGAGFEKVPRLVRMCTKAQGLCRFRRRCHARCGPDPL
eukprot:4026883-Pyramimonas_sp.AAC.1